VPEPKSEQWAEHLKILQKHSHSELLTDDFVQAGARQYYAMISLIDQKVGALIAQLEAQGALEDTLIIYASDHGEMLGDHGLMAKMCFYQGSVRVPMIIRPPGGCGGTTYTAPVQAFDLVATMLEAANAAPLSKSPARSLLPVLTDQTHKVRELAHSTIRMRPGLPTWVGVSDGELRLTYDKDSGECVEVFNLKTDPLENHNLTGLVTYQDRANALLEASQKVLS
jgi:choline-sulfatase